MKAKHRRDKEAIENMTLLQPGEYCYIPGVGWHACTPNGYLANLAGHDCEYDKENDMLTVAPSISVRAHRDEDPPGEVVEVYHGYLERNTWRDA